MTRPHQPPFAWHAKAMSGVAISSLRVSEVAARHPDVAVAEEIARIDDLCRDVPAPTLIEDFDKRRAIP